MWGQFANPSERFKLGLSMAGTRIRDLGIRIGRFQPGPFNAIADIEGIRVGHTDIAGTGLLTGLTAVIPFSGTPEKHNLFLGRWTLDGGAKMSGLPVAEDFGTFSRSDCAGPRPCVWRSLRWGDLLRTSTGRGPFDRRGLASRDRRN